MSCTLQSNLIMLQEFADVALRQQIILLVMSRSKCYHNFISIFGSISHSLQEGIARSQTIAMKCMKLKNQQQTQNVSCIYMTNQEIVKNRFVD